MQPTSTWLGNVTECSPILGVDFHSCFTGLCYADNVVRFTMHLDVITEPLELLEEEASPLGLTISWTTTKTQPLSDFLPPPLQAITINNEQVEVVNEFVYRGSKLSSSCSSEPEFARCIPCFDHFTNNEVYRRTGSPITSPLSSGEGKGGYSYLTAWPGRTIGFRQVLSVSARPPPRREVTPLSWITQVAATRPLADVIDLAQDRPTIRRLATTVT